MAVRAAKQLLRKEVKLRISDLGEEEKLRQSKIVTDKLLSSEHWRACQRLSLFLNMQDEIRTSDILHAALAANKECYIPRYVGSVMDMVQLHSWDDFVSLPETSWKIKQPADDDSSRQSATDAGPSTKCYLTLPHGGYKVYQGGLDLMLIPGLAFTRAGQRLGRGKGYYDSYLHQYRQLPGLRPVTTIALAFKEQLYDSIPTSEHDALIDIVLFDGC